ncbi:MAG: rhomboid family intramembrane serine protease [Anaerolineae bacterium]|nr:MAG: rhomboid family intramembrane serine protease [Anaerolineae bacterium]
MIPPNVAAYHSPEEGGEIGNSASPDRHSVGDEAQLPSPFGRGDGGEALPPPSVMIRYPQSKPLVTYILMGICILVYLAQMASEFLLGSDLPALLGMKINQAILNGEVWRFLTPMFLHGSILHIAFNLYALYIFGPSLEGRFGRGRFLLLFLISGLVGNIFSFVFSSAASLGSSTAIFGLLGAEMVFSYRNQGVLGSGARRVLINVITVAGINLIIGLSPGIDNWGHVGGLVGGSLFTWFGGPLLAIDGIYPNLTVTDRREPKTVFLAALGVGAGFLALAAFWIILQNGG